MRKVWMIAMILASAVLTGCTGATPEPVTYTIEMSEYAFTPDVVEVQVGQPVTIELINVGALEHEIMFGRTVREVNNRPSGYEQDMFETAGVEPRVEEMIAAGDEGEMASMEEEEHEGFMVLLPKSGDRATITFTPTREMVGEWEMGCFEQEGVHYDAGMKGKLVVTE